ncbi:MAG: hypothetical protein ACRDJV_10690 [Actinomycetota bacterium]
MNGDRDIRELLRAKAVEIRRVEGIPSSVLRRSKRRRALTASALSLTVVIAGAGVLAGVRAMNDRPRLNPVQPAPSRTERVEVRRQRISVVDPIEISTVEAARGRHPDGHLWRLQVGRAGRQYCAELLPGNNGTCWGANQMTDRFPLDVHMQGAGSESRYQFIVGSAGAEIDRVELNLARRGNRSVELATAPEELGTDTRLYVAFAPKGSSGVLVAYDAAGQEVDRIRFVRAMEPGAAACEGTRSKADLSGTQSPTLPFPGMGPIEIFASSFAALWSAGSTGCEAGVTHAPRRVKGGTR